MKHTHVFEGGGVWCSQNRGLSSLVTCICIYVYIYIDLHINTDVIFQYCTHTLNKCSGPTHGIRWSFWRRRVYSIILDEEVLGEELLYLSAFYTILVNGRTLGASSLILPTQSPRQKRRELVGYCSQGSMIPF